MTNAKKRHDHRQYLHLVEQTSQSGKRRHRIEADQWGPLPKESARRNPEWRMASAFHDLYMFINSTRDAGGIEKLVSTWSSECRAQYLQEIKNIISVLQRWASFAEANNMPLKGWSVSLHPGPSQISDRRAGN